MSRNIILFKDTCTSTKQEVTPITAKTSPEGQMNAERLFLYSLLLILHFISCASKDSIKTTEIIRDGDVLISKGNDFALGFFSPGKSSNRYLGIWYHRLPEKTVVWVANRNHPIIGSSGVLSFDEYGNLILYSDTGRNVSVWSANVSGEEADTSVAQLLDSGNFVLVQESGNILWQSFDYPTHYVLPGMKLGLDLKKGLDRFLTSWRSADDPGIGDYSYRVNPSGSPQIFLYKGEKRVWRTSPWPWRPQRRSYNTKFVNDQDEIGMTTAIPADDSVMTRLLVDYSGFVKAVKWHESDGQWRETWRAPRSKCDSYGWCGPYSTCEPTDVNKFECSCLPGFEPRNPSDWMLRNGSTGCVRKRLESSSVCRSGEGFLKVEIVFLPDTSAAVWLNMDMSHADCERECKRNCSCSAYARVDIPDKGTGCLTWYGELVDAVRYNMSDRYDLYVRVDALELAENARKSNEYLEKEIPAILIPTVSSALLVISIVAYFWRKRRGNKGTRVKNELQRSSSDQDLAFFKLSTISAATNKFSADNKLGQGGFGSVYKGELPDGEKIAVKRLSKNSKQGVQEFTNEVKVIAKLQHRNLVRLVGCCTQGGEQMLIYEYMPNKSLDSFLFNETRKLLLDWSKRFDIIVGIARGILYLHQDSRLRIIHRDLKCSNILLDAEMTPKISDFGIARIFKSDQTLDNTKRVVGTFGYMSPEYAVFGKFSLKSDVFSFGVMLLEIVSGKKNNEFNPHNPAQTLIGLVWGLWKEDRALEIVDSSLQVLYHPQEALKCIKIGLLCVQEDAKDRPSMLAVVFMLNSSETTIPSPKQPAFTFREPCSSTHEAVSGCLDLTVTDIEGR